MRKLGITLWLLIPVLVVAWHQGPGQAYQLRDDAGQWLRQGAAAADQESWAAAESCFAKALDALPADAVDERRAVQLARSRALVRSGQMVEGQQQLAQLLADLQGESQIDKRLLAEVRHESAWASYYAAWQMRLDGASAEEWKPEAEQARQQFRLLAEASATADQRVALEENLEAAIRLEQMDLSELVARPKPKNCPECQGLCKRKRKGASQCEQPGNKPGTPKTPQDARQQIKEQRGAGVNVRQDGGS
jgi:hypothetical protein